MSSGLRGAWLPPSDLWTRLAPSHARHDGRPNPRGGWLSTTRLSVFIASSLDGYIATHDGSLTWLEQAASSDEDYGYSLLLESVDALAMGRGTYDFIAHVDPLPFDGRPVFVFTHHPPQPREGVTFWQELPQAALDRWTAMGLGRVYIDGGALISDFLAEGLIDDLALTKAPCFWGAVYPCLTPSR
jgi:dihydrofolate reductase